jgi:hypothetical protein
MQIDPARQTKPDNYKLLTNLVVPRPIAWVTSRNAAGIINLAPFSFFNAVGSDPLYVVIGIGRRDNGEPKDTAQSPPPSCSPHHRCRSILRVWRLRRPAWSANCSRPNRLA